jgi:oligoendopeptidase F
MTGLLSCLLVAAAATAQESGGPPERSAIEEHYKWNLADMYASEAAWNKHHAELEEMIGRFAKLKGTTGRGPNRLLRVLQLHDQLNVQLERLHAYASHKFDQNMLRSESQALRDRARTLIAKYQEAGAWLEPELTSLPREQLDKWLEAEDLTLYRHYFDNLLRLQEHILSPREEELLAMASKATGSAANTFSLLTNTELKYRTIEDADGNELTVTVPVYYDLIYSKDRRVRRDVYLALHRSYLDVKNALASTLEGAAQRDWFYAKARGYDSSLQAALDQENLPVAVYHNLINTVNDNLPLLHRYTELRKKILKLDEVHPYDLYVSLVDVPEQRYTYEEAVELIVQSLEPMGPEYLDALQLGFRSRWIDVYENKGKRSGAYCGGAYLAHPYVLLNFKGNYSGVSTVAHEMGHAMQSHFANNTQPPVYADYPMFTAEVASTAAEIIFKQQILSQTTDKRQRAQMIDRMLDDIRQTVFRQTRFAEFDLVIHEMAEKGEPMTAPAVMAKSREIFQKYYGPELVLDAEADVECLRVPHHYYNFYVYRYADSYSAAATIAKRIMAREPGAVDDWMKFLKTGNSMYAIDMLKIAGADMTTPQPVEDCMALFEDLLSQLEDLLDIP